ncbi:pyridoxamine 5'-phosphate oxidase [Mucilaginibacter sp. PPCGB 2223]|uniref:pyridoxamine 5'-phosphate oxidase family protein n=1 Tax=Mucilaginibacter sp. PPCGB 2223 TaxID=1886027 RepID=UPI0008260B64|nr:pyridoxamine 5'-phosphate oxidase family protein [Mucilaginibacter sp. PPCGB 2223]OCX53917.1 pyridoxamine 5'-phosphate oxidase [Mucilaginibacter sp. PPCGB 2223]
MLGTLDEKQIDDLLTRQVTGRIGCHAGGTTYIVPVNYVYRSPNIFAHSAYGKKIMMMRKNPKVCFQVDEIRNIFNWQSVIAWGQFEEITDISEKERVMQGLIHRIMPMVDQPSGHPSHGITESEYDIGTSVELIVYKIVLTKKTGRFETRP